MRNRTIGAIADALGDDAPFMLLLMLASFALVPGAAPVFATAMIVIASSLMIGRDRLALPASLRRRAISPRSLDRAVRRLARFERRLGVGDRRRRSAATRPAALLVIWNALLVILPIPLGNGPPAVAALLVSLGVIERNRRALAIGLGATVIATVFEGTLLWAGIDLAARLWHSLGR